MTDSSTVTLLNYLGPSEILANQPTILKGIFDPKRIVQVTVVAEDKFPLTVTLDSQAGLWQIALPNGFTIPGTRWLRIRGLDSSGTLIDQKVAYLTIGTDANTIGKPYTLKVTSNTFLKVSASDSTSLNDRQKVLVKQGQTFNIIRYGFADGHLKVELRPPVPPVGSFGYFYELHVQLFKGDQQIPIKKEADPPETQTMGQLVVVRSTLLKAKPADSSTLPANQKVVLRQDQILDLTGYASVPGHFRVSLAQEIPGFGRFGYAFKNDVQVRERGRIIPFNPSGFSVRIIKSTLIKKKPISSGQLSESEKKALPSNGVYGLTGYALATSNHVKVSLTEEFPEFGNTGFLYRPDVQIMRAGKVVDLNPSEVTLNVPHFSQRDNPRLPWATCNVTAIAMVLYYHGLRSKNPQQQLEDELLQWCYDNYPGVKGSQTDNAILSNLIKAYGFQTSFKTTRRWAEVKAELINGRPVVIGGYFTHGGHIVTAIGFNPNGYLINDPWGDAMTGYRNTEGRRVHYPNGYMNQVAGPDGNVWAHFIANE